MTESSQVNINLSFQASRGTWMALSAAGAMMVVGILAAVTLGVAWMSASDGGDTVDYKLSELSSDGSSIEYGELADLSQGQVDGDGMILTAKILAIIGVVSAFLAMVVLAVSLFVRGVRLTLIGSILAAATTVLLILAVVFAPIGISSFHDDIVGSDVSLDWGAGLIIGIIAAVIAIGATTAGFLSLRDPIVS